MSKVKVWEGNDGKFYWHCQADNGEVVAQGEGYESRSGAWRGYSAALRNMLGAEMLDGDGPDGPWREANTARKPTTTPSKV